MPTFHYQAGDALGRRVEGSINAEGLSDALASLKARDLTVWSIGAAAKQLATGPLAEAVDRLVGVRERIASPLKAYATEAASPRRRRELMAIARRLETPDRQALIDAAVAEPTSWGPLLAAATVVKPTPFAAFIERERPVATLRRRRWLAAIYPLFVGGLCLAIGWPIASVIMPQFESIFADFGLELPGLTALVLAAGRFVREGGLVALAGLALLIYLAWRLFRLVAPGFTGWLGDRLRGAGQGRSLASARLAAHTADLIEAGLPLTLAAQAAAERVGGPQARRCVDATVGTAPRRGRQRSLDLALSDATPDASRVRLLRTLSACHNDLAAPRSAWAAGVAGPVTIVVMGALVGLIVLALFLPLVKLVQGLS